MKLMAFVGSPRKGGNTDILMDKVIEGAKSKTEVDAEKIYLYEANIKYCNGCGAHTVLKGSKDCPLGDDMQGILERMIGADAFIFGSPNHGRTISAAMTNFIARMMPLLKMEVVRDAAGNIIDARSKPLVGGKKAVMVVSQGDPWPSSSSLVGSKRPKRRRSARAHSPTSSSPLQKTQRLSVPPYQCGISYRMPATSPSAIRR